MNIYASSLQAEYLEADEETIQDTLEGLSSLPDALATIVRSYLNDIALAAALGIRMERCRRGSIASSTAPTRSA